MILVRNSLQKSVLHTRNGSAIYDLLSQRTPALPCPQTKLINNRFASFVSKRLLFTVKFNVWGLAMSYFNDSVSILDERQQVGVDLLRVRGGHPVRQSRVGFQRPLLQEFDRLCSGSCEGADLVVLAMHH